MLILGFLCFLKLEAHVGWTDRWTDTCSAT